MCAPPVVLRPMRNIERGLVFAKGEQHVDQSRRRGSPVHCYELNSETKSTEGHVVVNTNPIDNLGSSSQIQTQVASQSSGLESATASLSNCRERNAVESEPKAKRMWTMFRTKIHPLARLHGNTLPEVHCLRVPHFAGCGSTEGMVDIRHMTVIARRISYAT